MKKLKYTLLLGITAFLIHCDTKKDYFEDVGANLLCTTYAICNGETPAKTGIIGDSWTDILLGFPMVETLRPQLENRYHYKFAGATLGGKTLQGVVSQGLQFQVIDQGGADMKVVLLSLGGNDIQANLSEYIGKIDTVQAQRFATIKANLKQLIITGNAYKIARFGGAPIKWIIHGYDYPNPYMPPVIAGSEEGCKTKFDKIGLIVPDAAVFTSNQVDAFNNLLLEVTREEPSLIYVDLRSTLGGRPNSRAELMLDCIHANNLGYTLLADKLARIIYPITNIGL
ncbi:SGNH/GDSL hydrolase family protein [Leptospira meyeri]|uniref:GDSL-like lipase/acylhydrolase family protein n=1 Tax=Leptospira meyeri TaxID=29508 RepID=A0A4V3HIU4_LEPME|nr:SGNH/GDSL hydrolase family protein [Leptospira meyeri]EKJ86306.1 GDSL-like protein [Leptospira meyeri serovar Hardjo str. Went 5]EMJ87944.1 GDSL-like protein [Leptospira meyeri serovar Semaranga str. Veldrot Semarang 173]TDY73261.1 GDSL-like lipase/acylhydrolase family protein [Leptospira meyeri]TGL49800.1 SGNH/GDSL hydrolase family protein [Leptospira meyeri]